MNRIATLPLLALALVACQSTAKAGKPVTISTQPQTPSIAAGTPSAPTPVSAAPVVASSAPAAPASSAAPTVGQFGPTHGITYPSGLTVSILSATKFVPSADAAGTVAGDGGVELTIRLTNGTKASFDPTGATVDVHAGANGDEGSEVVDDTVGDGFEGAIPVGQSATAKFGFDVPTADLPVVTVDVSPDFTDQDASFTGAVS